MEEEDPFGMKEFREYIYKMYPDLPDDKFKVTEERLIESVKAATQDIGNQHVLGGPLLDILSVSLRLKIAPPPQGNWRIAGNIHVCQPADAQRGITEPIYHPMFQRDSDNAQFLNPDAPYLTLDHTCPIFGFFPYVHLYLNLTKKRPRNSRLEPLFEDLLPLDHTNYQDDMFDKVQHHDFMTSNADLCVKYITYRAACSAKVSFSFDVPMGQQPHQLKVSGKIHASWHHTKGDFVPHPEHERNCSCVCLFDSSCIFVTPGHPLQLIRSCVAVPSYATLILELVLSIDGVNCYHVLDFPAEDTEFSQKEFVAAGFVGRCKLQWETEYAYLHEEPEEAITSTERQKRTKLILSQVPKPICFCDTVLDMELAGKQMTEIFSIYVGANEKNTVYRLNGTIIVQDRLHKHRILEMNDDNSRIFAHGMKLSLTGPEICLRGTCFLQVDLRDDEGQEFCRGYMGWNDPLIRPPWLDKWMCSVIKGQLGFAAIYYALHTSAVSSAVNVFLAAPSSCENVYISGLIAGGYDIEYTTAFDKNYYRSFLFHKGEDKDESMVLEFREKRKLVNIPNSRLIKAKHNKYWISMPLSKSVVCVPTDNTLLIEVNLSVECDNIYIAPLQKLMGTVEFQTGRKTWHMISSEDYQMFICVDWS